MASVEHKTKDPLSVSQLCTSQEDLVRLNGLPAGEKEWLEKGKE